MTAISVALDIDNYLGETPIWSPQDQALWWVNCEKPAELHRWEPATGVKNSSKPTALVGASSHSPPM